MGFSTAGSSYADITAVPDLRRPSGVLAETYPRWIGSSNSSPLTSGTLNMGMIYIPAGTVVTKLSIFSATTAAGTPTNQWLALYDAATLAKLAVTADDGATAWAANTEKSFWISRSVTDAAITSGQAVVTSNTAAFTQSDVGKNVTFMGAGAAGVPLGTTAAPVTILSVQSATQATLNTNAGTTVASGGTLYIATPYTDTAGGTRYFGTLMAATTVISVAAATANNGVFFNDATRVVGQSTTALTAATGAPGTAAALTGTPAGLIYGKVT